VSAAAWHAIGDAMPSSRKVPSLPPFVCFACFVVNPRSPSAPSVQSVVKLRGLGSDPRSISPRITRISRMQRCSSPATVAKPQRLPAALSSSLFARDASASCAKLAKAQRKAFSLPLLSAKSVQSAVKLRSPFSGLRFSSCALCVPCAA
jgi:hypothetical protein